MVLEPDRLYAKYIKTELENRDFVVKLVSNADLAISLADDFRPNLVISELSLSGHSASEFFYEFRSYVDFSKIPIIIYSSMKLDNKIWSVKDWKLLNISKTLYKPEDSLKILADEVERILE